MIGYAARNSEGALRAEIWENLIRKSEKMPTLSFAHYFRAGMPGRSGSNPQLPATGGTPIVANAHSQTNYADAVWII